MSTFHIATVPTEFTLNDITSNFEALNKHTMLLDGGEEVEIKDLYDAYQMLAKTGILIEDEVDKNAFFALYSVMEDEGFVLTSLETQGSEGDTIALIHAEHLNKTNDLVQSWESSI